jgi:hypothetical protein
VNSAKVQDKPIVTEFSKDVFEDLVKATNFTGHELISGELAERLSARIDFGFKKYGSRLKTFNGRDVLLDIEQELLDGIQYSHQGIMEGHRVAHIRNGLITNVKELLRYRRIMGV